MGGDETSLVSVINNYYKPGPAMLERNWKLYKPRNGPYELYDLDTDPGEVFVLATIRTDIVDLMAPKLDAWVATLPDAYNKDDVISPLPPDANAGADQEVFDLDGDNFDPVTLDASDSSDPDGYIPGCIWRQDGEVIAITDGPTVSLPLGTHAVEAEVTDYAGNTSFDDVTITVSPTPDMGITDLSLFGAYWLGNCDSPNWCESMDINHDYRVNMPDFAFLANLGNP